MIRQEQYKNYVPRPAPVKAKLFVEGDQDGYAGEVHGEPQTKVPYIRTDNGIFYLAFGTHYIYIEKGVTRTMPKEAFEKQYESLDH